MIIPGLFHLFLRRPTFSLAWSFFFINLVIYAYSEISFKDWPSKILLEQAKDKNFSNSLVEMYKQTLDPMEIKALHGQVAVTDALRDHRFWKRVATFPFTGDQVQIELNRQRLIEFQHDYFLSSQFQLGLGQLESTPWAWVTYQFTHASFLHFFSNMLIVFLLISYLETSVGLFWIISVYLFGGFGGGISYLLFEGSGSVAVVGASASAFALMGFLIVVKKAELMPWSYLIAPVSQGYGIIYLPAFFIFPVFVMSDFIAALWEPAGVTSSVAISAHIGGALTGFALGVAYLCEQELTKFLIRIWQIDERKLSELDL
jgi:membrane associated rhomboid family serine protease